MKDKSLNKIRLLIIALVLLGIGILTVSVILLRYRAGYKADSDAYKSIEKKALDSDTGKFDLDSLKSINEDAVAWLWACNGLISGPVVSSTDDDYYLHHRFDRQEAACGTFFADRYTSPAFKSPITIVFGHNMNDGSMFNKLLEYKNESYLKENDSFTVFTEKGAEKYKIFSVFFSDYYDIPWIAERCKPGSANEGVCLNYRSRGGLGMKDFLERVSERSLFKVDISDVSGLEHEAKVVVLCTCENIDADKRFVVYGVHIQ